MIFKEDLAGIFGEGPFAERVPAPQNGKPKDEKPAQEVAPEEIPDVTAENKTPS